MLLEELKGIVEKQRAARKETCIRCCMASGCMSSRSAEIRDLLQKAVVEKNLVDRVEVRRVGCMGFCGQGPMIDIEPQGLLFEHVNLENAASIVDALLGGTAVAQLGDM